jgi:Na+-driven multidrug efflux pump
MSLLDFIFVLFPSTVLTVFRPELDVKLLSIIALIICAFEQIPLGIFMVITGGLKGAGDTKTPMIISVVGSLLVRVPVVYLLAFKLNLGFVGVWIGAAADWWVKAILGIIAYYRGRWREIEFK